MSNNSQSTTSLPPTREPVDINTLHSCVRENEGKGGKINLLNYDQQGLAQLFTELDEKPYRATQLLKWIHYYGHTDLSQMTNFSKPLRARLQEICEIALPKIVLSKTSSDGTYKWLLQLEGGSCVETVFIPEEGRGTLCISSQIGCALDCTFCSTGKQGFNRNLTVAEIIAQVWVAVRELSQEQGVHDRRVTNVVLMGMGEPLLNFEPVVAALNIMLDDNAYGLSKRRVTLSTSGIVPTMIELSQRSPVALAVSLHAANDELRDVLVPINKKYPLAELMAVCRSYFKDEPRRCVTFEYVMLAGVNDSITHARQLVQLLQGVPAKVNLIPFNPFPGAQYQCSDRDTMRAFQNKLMCAGINTTIRKTRGDDIDAACGQLVGQVADKTKRSIRWQKQLKEK